jgi:hypothetical protein
LDNPSILLTENEWTQLKELEGLLSYPFSVTKMLQAEDLTPGVF